MSERREFLAAGAGLAATSLLTACASTPPEQDVAVAGTAHWTTKRTGAGDVRLFMWRKRAADTSKGVLVFVHGSSVSATPVFDLQIPGRPGASTMDWFARLGFDAWCFDCEGYGRSDKWRPVNADIACGADDLATVSEYILKETGARKLHVYGASSGALRAALFAQRHPDRVQRLVLDAFVWTGKGSPTLAERRKRLPQFLAANRRPIDREFVRSIFTRDHPGTSDLSVVEAFADAVLALDQSVPTGTYVDMSANLPLVDPARVTVPTLILRGQWDGIASFEDLSEFFARLPNPDKQFAVMPGIAHSSTRSKNWALVYHLLAGYLTQPAPVYTG